MKKCRFGLVNIHREELKSAAESPIQYFLIDDYGTTKVVLRGVPAYLRGFFEKLGFLSSDEEKGGLYVVGGHRTIERLSNKEEMASVGFRSGGAYWRGFSNLAR